LVQDTIRLRGLTERITSREAILSVSPAQNIVKTGWAEVDATIGGLARGVVHEWFGNARILPVAVLQYLAKRAGVGQHVWIGKSCWPCCTSGSQTVLLDPPNDAARVWALDLAIRCPAVATVIVDGSGFNMAVTRRMQLAAAQGGAFVLIARPSWELRELSAAAMRWSVKPLPTEQDRPRWNVELLRCKGMQPASHAPRRWVVELTC
jgi:protein ImuA